MQGLQLVFARVRRGSDRIVAMEKMSVNDSLPDELENPPDMQRPVQDKPASPIEEPLPAAVSEAMSPEDSEVLEDGPQNESDNPINRELGESVRRDPPLMENFQGKMRNSRNRRHARRRARDILGDFAVSLDRYLRDCDVREPPKYHLMRSRNADRPRNERNNIPKAESSAGPKDPFRFQE